MKIIPTGNLSRRLKAGGLFVLLLAWFCGCEFSNPFQKGERETFLKIDIGKTNTALYDSIIYYAVKDTAAARVHIATWKPGDSRVIKHPIPAGLGEKFDLIIEGKKNGKVINARKTKIGANSLDSNKSTYLPHLIEFSPLPDTLYQKGVSVVVEPSISCEGLYHYLWLKDDDTLSHSANLLIANFSDSDTGTYKLHLVHKMDPTITFTDTFNFHYALEFIVDLDSHYIAPLGYEFTLQVTVTDTNSLFNWYHNDTLMKNQNRNVLRFDSTVQNNSGKYYVVVTNSLDSLQSGRAHVQVVDSLIPITIELSTGGSIKHLEHPSPNQVLVIKGSNPNFQFEPDTGYSLDSVFVDEVIDPEALTNKRVFFPEVQGPHSLRAVFKLIENMYPVKVLANDGNAVLKEPDKISYAWGDTVRLTPKPLEGYRFEAWVIKDSSSTDSVFVHVVMDTLDIEARFVKKSYPISAISEDTTMGRVIITPEQPEYNYGGTITLSANPEPGYRFAAWKHNGAKDSVIRHTVTGTATLVAWFAPIDSLRLDVDSVPGNKITVWPEKKFYLFKDTVTLTAEPGDAFEFLGWKLIGSDTTLTANPWVIEMSGDVHVTGYFPRRRPIVNFFGMPPQGQDTAMLVSGYAEWGLPAKIFAIPAFGYNFSKWETASGPGEVVFADFLKDTTTITVNKDTVDITAFYVKKKFLITYEPDAGGDVVGPDSAVYAEPTPIKAVPKPEYLFLGWEVVSGTAQFTDSTQPSTTVTLSEGDATLKPVFKEMPYLPDVIFSDTSKWKSFPEGNWFDSSFTLTLSLSKETAGAVIRYTTDGSEPDTGSTPYQNPISIDTTITIKARAFLNGFNPSKNLGVAKFVKNQLPTFTVISPELTRDSAVYPNDSMEIAVKAEDDQSVQNLSIYLDTNYLGTGRYADPNWYATLMLVPAKWNEVRIKAADVFAFSPEDTIHIFYEPKLSKPSGLRASNIERTSLTLAWDPVRYVTHYTVFGSTNGVDYAPLDTVQDTLFTDSSLIAGANYWYQVQGFYQPEGGHDINSATELSDAFKTHTTIVFATSEGFAGQGYGRVVFQAPDSGYYVGATIFKPGFSTEMGLVGFDSVGVVRIDYPKYYNNSTGSDATHDMIQSESGFVLTGQVFTADSGSNVLIVKTDGANNRIWQRRYGFKGDDIGFGVIQSSDGGFLVVGQTGPVSSSSGYVVKLTASGDTSWTRIYGQSAICRLYKVLQDGVGDYYAVGDSGNTAWVVRIGADGSLKQSQTYPNSAVGKDIDSAGSGNFVIVGLTTTMGSGGGDIYLLKIDKNLGILDEKPYGGSGDDMGYSVFNEGDSAYVVAGSTRSWEAKNEDALIMKINTTGDLVWYRYFGDTGTDYAVHAARTSDGGYVLTGTFDGDKLYLIKTDRTGKIED